MFFDKQKKFLFFLLAHCFLVFGCCSGLCESARSKGFVYVHEIDPTIRVSLRYNTSENFTGKPVGGYHAPVIIVTRSAAEALKKVQADVKKDGYDLVVYDAYRPQQAVNRFMAWSKDVADQTKKKKYYPRVDKARIFELGYVAERSGHSRGSTVDLTLIKSGDLLHSIVEKKRTLSDGFVITLLDDGTVDMGSSFDLFDIASHYENNLIGERFKSPRAYLKRVMEKHGFKNYANEWWHFTLKNEPFPADRDDNYFDFEIE